MKNIFQTTLDLPLTNINNVALTIKNILEKNKTKTVEISIKEVSKK